MWRVFVSGLEQAVAGGRGAASSTMAWEDGGNSRWEWAGKKEKMGGKGDGGELKMYLADVLVPFLRRYAHFDRLLHLPRGYDDAVQRPRRDGCHCAGAAAVPACDA